MTAVIFARSLLLPPPRPMTASARKRRAGAVQASAARSDGSGSPPSKVSTITPASASGARTRSATPALTRTVSVTRRTRRAPRRPATSPSWRAALRPNSSWPAAWNVQVSRMAGLRVRADRDCRLRRRARQQARKLGSSVSRPQGHAGAKRVPPARENARGARRPAGSSMIGPPPLLHNGQDVVLGHDEVLFAVEGDLVAGVRCEQDAVAFLYLEGRPLAVVQQLAIAEAEDLALLGLLLGGVGQDDAAGGLLLGLQALDHDLVIQRYDFHAGRAPS